MQVLSYQTPYRYRRCTLIKKFNDILFSIGMNVIYHDIQSEFFDRLRIVWAELLSRKTSISLNQFFLPYFYGEEMFSRTTPVLMSGGKSRENGRKQRFLRLFTPFLTSIPPSPRGLSAWE